MSVGGAAAAPWRAISGNLAPAGLDAAGEAKADANSQEEKVDSVTRPASSSGIGPPPSSPLPPLPGVAAVGLASVVGAGAGPAPAPSSLPFNFDKRFYADPVRASLALHAAQKCAFPEE